MADQPRLDMERAREAFEASTDFTIGLEEEFAIVDPGSLELQDRFEDLYGAAMGDEVLKDSAAGELIASEIEIRSGRGENFSDAIALQRERRERLFALAAEMGLGLASTGTHPWANYLDQTIIDTPHYRRLRKDLGWVAQRNNTWSLHVHIGVQGADRAIAVCDWMRELLPILLAVSANSPFLDNRDTGLHTVRTQIFTRTFPRCGIPSPFNTWSEYSDFVEMLNRVGSAIESTQLWWSVRPHHTFGTVEVRICDAQVRAAESEALAGLITACVAQTAMALDEGEAAGEPLADRQIEENLWRAIRHGLDGELIDFRRGTTLPARAAVEELLQWTQPAQEALGITVDLPEQNGAQRALAALEGGASIPEIYRAALEETTADFRRPAAPARERAAPQAASGG